MKGIPRGILFFPKQQSCFKNKCHYSEDFGFHIGLGFEFGFDLNLYLDFGSDIGFELCFGLYFDFGFDVDFGGDSNVGFAFAFGFDLGFKVSVLNTIRDSVCDSLHVVTVCYWD